MDRDIVLFYYYSSPPVPECCFLGLSTEIAYRNMFLLPCPDEKVHFEFPMFEDHSYNTVCNRLGVRALIQRPKSHAKYMIFRTRGNDIIGFYRVRRAYYQETNMFNNNGFVWGIEADAYLIRKGAVKYKGAPLRQGFKASWHSEARADLVNELLCDIEKQDNIGHVYQSETNRLINVFQSSQRMRQWQEHCASCASQTECTIHAYFDKYNKEHQGANIFLALNHVYNSNLYSRNVLTTIPKLYLESGGS